MAQLPRWKVVGGEQAGGILARRGRELTSEALAQRLAPGALVEELELAPEVGRLRFRKLAGEGPTEGWVSLRIREKDLLVRETVAAAASVPPEPARPAAPAAPPVPAAPPAPAAPPTPASPAAPRGGLPPAPACTGGGQEMLQLPRWVVVGRGSNGIVQRLLAHLASRGRKVSHVDPYGASGPDVPRHLTELPLGAGPDVVDICARPDLGEEVIEECKKLGIRNVFVQPGAGSASIEAVCAEAGIAVHNGCVLVELP